MTNVHPGVFAFGPIVYPVPQGGWMCHYFGGLKQAWSRECPIPNTANGIKEATVVTCDPNGGWFVTNYQGFDAVWMPSLLHPLSIFQQGGITWPSLTLLCSECPAAFRGEGLQGSSEGTKIITDEPSALPMMPLGWNIVPSLGSSIAIVSQDNAGSRFAEPATFPVVAQNHANTHPAETIDPDASWGGSDPSHMSGTSQAGANGGSSSFQSNGLPAQPESFNNLSTRTTNVAVPHGDQVDVPSGIDNDSPFETSERRCLSNNDIALSGIGNSSTDKPAEIPRSSDLPVGLPPQVAESLANPLAYSEDHLSKRPSSDLSDATGDRPQMAGSPTADDPSAVLVDEETTRKTLEDIMTKRNDNQSTTSEPTRVPGFNSPFRGYYNNIGRQKASVPTIQVWSYSTFVLADGKVGDKPFCIAFDYLRFSKLNMINCNAMINRFMNHPGRWRTSGSKPSRAMVDDWQKEFIRILDYLAWYFRNRPRPYHAYSEGFWYESFDRIKDLPELQDLRPFPAEDYSSSDMAFRKAVRKRICEMNERGRYHQALSNIFHNPFDQRTAQYKSGFTHWQQFLTKDSPGLLVPCEELEWIEQPSEAKVMQFIPQGALAIIQRQTQMEHILMQHYVEVRCAIPKSQHLSQCVNVMYNRILAVECPPEAERVRNSSPTSNAM